MISFEQHKIIRQISQGGRITQAALVSEAIIECILVFPIG